MSLSTSSRHLVAAIVVVAALGLCACGDDEPTTSSAGDAAQNASFPVTIRHQLGTTTIPSAPKRVVTVGLRDQDFVLALGVKPVGVRDWYGKRQNAIWPWAQEAVGTSKPVIVGDSSGLKFEQIAALRPDVIVGLYAGLTEAEYGKLKRIAPTVADSERYADFAIPWEAQLKITAEALGQEAKATKTIADLKARFAKERKAHPEFAGKQAVYGGLAGDPGLYTSVDQRGAFLTDLGFSKVPEIDRLAPKAEAYFAGFSIERYRLLDRDVAVVVGPGGTKAKQIAAQPLYKRLKVVRENRAIYLDELEGPIAGALTFGSPLSLEYALDEMVPRLAAAADGDPATIPAPEPRG